jgi:hypothetical protein
MQVAVGKKLEKGGVSASVKMNLKFNQISIKDKCNAQNIECCVVPLESESSNIYPQAILNSS